jgi:hypothetical protein
MHKLLINFSLFEKKTDPVTKKHNLYPWNFTTMLEDLVTYNYKDIVSEEL